MRIKPKLVRFNKTDPVLVNAGETRSVVGSDNTAIAAAMSILYGVLGEHPGRLTPDQARDVIAWANR